MLGQRSEAPIFSYKELSTAVSTIHAALRVWRIDAWSFDSLSAVQLAAASSTGLGAAVRTYVRPLVRPSDVNDFVKAVPTTA